MQADHDHTAHAEVNEATVGRADAHCPCMQVNSLQVTSSTETGVSGLGCVSLVDRELTAGTTPLAKSLRSNCSRGVVLVSMSLSARCFKVPPHFNPRVDKASFKASAPAQKGQQAPYSLLPKYL